jgi:hypothetical protein
MRAAKIVPGGNQGPIAGATTAGATVLARPRNKGRAAIIWGGIGFLSGAVFWHAVGFWGFLGDVVLNGSTDARASAVEALPVIAADAPGVPLPTFFLVDADKCTALVIDRPSNRTRKLPCPETGLALRLEPTGDREDLVVLTTAPPVHAAGYRPD